MSRLWAGAVQPLEGWGTDNNGVLTTAQAKLDLCDTAGLLVGTLYFANEADAASARTALNAVFATASWAPIGVEL